MKPCVLFILLLACSWESAVSQYYYKDILGSLETCAKELHYRQNKVHQVIVHSYAPDGTEDTDFVCNQTLNRDFSRMETVTSAPATGNSLLTSYYDDSSRLIRTVDSNASAVTTTEYVYTSSGFPGSVVSRSTANNPDSSWTNSEEQHLWQYGPGGQPTGMFRIMGARDTTYVRFKSDAQGDITDEISTRHGLEVEHYFYYYDATNHLTDILHFNHKIQGMMPDYSFVYDESGRLHQMTVTQTIGGNYLIWLYAYDDNGLRIKEVCYDKDKELVGSLGYRYVQ